MQRPSYLLSVPTKNTKPQRLWRIARLRESAATEIGTVYAPDYDAAIASAIEKFGITDPLHKHRLIARPVAGSPTEEGNDQEEPSS